MTAVDNSPDPTDSISSTHYQRNVSTSTDHANNSRISVSYFQGASGIKIVDCDMGVYLSGHNTPPRLTSYTSPAHEPPAQTRSTPSAPASRSTNIVNQALGTGTSGNTTNSVLTDDELLARSLNASAAEPQHPQPICQRIEKRAAHDVSGTSFNDSGEQSSSDATRSGPLSG